MLKTGLTIAGIMYSDLGSVLKLNHKRRLLSMRKISLLLPFTFLLYSLHARIQSVAWSFVVFTFEDAHKISQYGLKRSYWVVPMDSIRADAFSASVLLLRSFTRSDLDSCCHGRPHYAFLGSSRCLVPLRALVRDRG